MNIYMYYEYNIWAYPITNLPFGDDSRLCRVFSHVVPGEAGIPLTATSRP
jgi:hypothetical protein